MKLPKKSADLKNASRRELLKMSPLLVGAVFLVPSWREHLLDKGVEFSDWASLGSFRKGGWAKLYKDSEVAPLEKFPYNFFDVVDPGIDLDEWTLTVGGQVQKPGEYKLADIQRLPKQSQNTLHVCVEGWDVVGNFGGTRLSDFFQAIGADTTSRFVEVDCADDYYESIDMKDALHPQTLLCYEMYGKPLDRGHGAPLRLQMPTKLGYKQAKYLTDLRVTNFLNSDRRGYWEDQGYSWHGGL